VAELPPLACTDVPAKESVEAFKFLDLDGTAVLTGYAWPLPSGSSPGPWVDAPEARPCHIGVHGCMAEHLAYWLGEELWVLELDGEIVHGRHKVAARRGRIVRRVDAWRAEVAADLCGAMALRGRDVTVEVLRHAGHRDAAGRLAACASATDVEAVAADIAAEVGEGSLARTAVLLAADCARFAGEGAVSGAAFVAACAVGNAARGSEGAVPEFTAAFHAERTRQSHWIADRLTVAGQRGG